MPKYEGKQNFSFLKGVESNERRRRRKREGAKVNYYNGQYIHLNQFSKVV